MHHTLKIRQFTEEQAYEPIWHAMQTFTDTRDTETEDELWLLNHTPVFTQGRAGKAEHILNPSAIPIIPIDRGGQVTYHGPGQLMAYTLLNLERLGLNTRDFVVNLEQVIIALLKDYNITAYGKREAPGVYVAEAKIASIGLRVRKNCSYHGLALNVAMDLTPFQSINPCGYAGLQVTQIAHFVPSIELLAVQSNFIRHFMQQFCYTAANYC